MASIEAPIGIFPLPDMPTATLSGPDARRFANGMFTNNVRDLPIGGSQRTGLTDDRGRLWALAELHCLADDRFLLHLDGQTAEAFAERYDTYIVFDDVNVETGSESGVSVQGPSAADVLEQAGLPVPGAGSHLVHGEARVVARDRSGHGTGFDVWGPSPLVATADASLLDALEIAAGQVRMVDVVRPGLPHEHGLREAILHFEKGCYLGQESIHRIDVMGNPRRGLAIVRGPGLTAGPLQAEGKDQGVVTRVAAVDGTHIGLAVLRKPHDAIGSRLTQGDVAVQVVAPTGA